MAKPAVLVLTGYGINCDEETRYAFERAGAAARIVHINDIISSTSMLSEFQIAVFPGGFSYGDDTGSGKALADRIRNNLMNEFSVFIGRDTLMMGICNGFQVMTNLGIVPGLEAPIGNVQISLESNTSARYQCRWVDLAAVPKNPSVFLRGIDRLHVPVAHGEGNFYAPPEVLAAIEEKGLVALRYARSDGSPARGEFPFNPNGSMNDIAAVSDQSGRILGMMPHPERNILFTQRDDWTYLREKARREGTRVPVEGEGLALFRNAVSYFG